MRELEDKEAQQKKQSSEADFKDKTEETDLRLSIDRLASRLEINREIRSEYTGRVLELTVAEGAVEDAGLPQLLATWLFPAAKRNSAKPQV